NAALDGLSEASSAKPTATDSILSALGKIIAKVWNLVIGDVGGLQTALDGKEPTLPTTANAYFRNDGEGARTAVTPQEVANEINPLLAGRKNVLINGCFRVNQRAVAGTVSLAAGEYGHDRWKAGA